MPTTRLSTCNAELTTLRATPIGSNRAPTRVIIAPWGRVRSSVGEFIVDEESGQLAIEAFREHGTDLPIDFEHQTLGGEYAAPDGTAPAAGWITALEAVPGEGIVACVNWTDAGRQRLDARAYRYLSPVALVRREDRKLIAVHSAALTNKPAIVKMAPLVNREPTLDVAVAAGRADDANGAVGTVRAVSTVGAVGATELAVLRERLDLEPTAAAETVLTAASCRIEDLESSLRRRDAEDCIRAARAAGKLSDAQAPWALRLCLSNRALFDDWLASAPVAWPPGRMVDDVTPPAIDPQAAARAEYRASRLLHNLTSEEAYVANACRTGAGNPTVTTMSTKE